MRHTFKIKSGNLDQGFIRSVRDIFGNKPLRIIVEDAEDGKLSDQRELYKITQTVFDRFKDAKIDPSIDLSALASEVNL
ncbi:hypothetical protein [Dyadobacter sp. CY343]|uniref:hypothetical protein n=1 Tax=Dyadobacter sp. CY343 TaxID=2907299 RepID=UPI001F2A209E|nr:hypothetical protein [Dyadobacter sp. CY343]MCE7060678.1 hypothetical protein [Dyadobacter sp. CY343]